MNKSTVGAFAMGAIVASAFWLLVRSSEEPVASRSEPVTRSSPSSAARTDEPRLAREASRELPRGTTSEPPPHATASSPSSAPSASLSSTPAPSSIEAATSASATSIGAESSGRLRQVEVDLERAQTAKDGRKMLALLKELSALGKEGWALAGEVLVRLQRSIDDENALGLNVHDFHRVARSGSFAELYATALADPRAKPALRRFAVRELPWTDREDVSDLLLKQVATEEDARLAWGIAQALAARPDPGNVPALVTAIGTQRDANARSGLLEALGAIPGNDATRAIEALIGTTADPELRKEAEVLAVSRRPPATGYLVTDIAKGSQAEAVGLKPGDIITSYNGQPVNAQDAIEQARATVRKDASVPLAVWRAGSTLAVTIKGPRIGVDGRFVKPEQTP